MFTTCGAQEHIFWKTMQTDKYVYIFFEKMLLGATSGEHFGSTFSVIHILLTVSVQIQGWQGQEFVE